MKYFNQPSLVATGVLGLTLAMAGCSTMSQNASPAMERHDGQNYTKIGMMDHRMGEHHGKMGMWRHQMGGAPDMHARMNQLMASLNLTDTQKAQVQQLHSQHAAQMQQLQTNMQQINANIAAQKKAGASTATLVSLYQQKQALMDQMMAMYKQHQHQLMQILTPEQQLKFYEHQRGMKTMPMMMRGNPSIQPMQSMPRNN